MSTTANTETTANIELLEELARHTYSAAVADACDHLDLRVQTLPSRIRRLTGEGTMAGWARTFTTVAVTETPERHYGGEIDFVDSLRPGDLPVGRVDADAAGWGELFSAGATGRGARGLVIDGLVRDVSQMDKLGFSVHGTGTRPTDALGRVALGSPDVPVQIGDVTVRSGDLIVADSDGITVVPADVAEDVARRAIEKSRTESDAKQLLLAGGTMAQMWERYRVM
ncbi:MAG: RraA family protein [Actinomycetia bacterium]|nr:RraA family protein [Actinomycetes bacterium]